MNLYDNPVLYSSAFVEGDEIILVDVFLDSTNTTIILSKMYYNSTVPAKIIDTAYFLRKIQDNKISKICMDLVNSNKDQFRDNDTRCIAIMITTHKNMNTEFYN